MTVIIPLRNGGGYDALRFALRSITTYHDVNQCILVGGKPDWYTGTHLPHKDYGPVFKEANIRDKTIAGSELIQGKFLFANDDHILMQPLTSTWNKGLLSECLRNRNGNGSYTRCLRNTLNHYGDVDNVDTHCPMWMTTERVKRTAFEWPEFGIGFKTCYAMENQVASEYMDDCKVASIPPAGREWFSLADNFPVQKLVDLFPNKCKFEI